MVQPVSSAPQEDNIEEFKPNFGLKEKIGNDITISEILTADAIKNSQQVINDSQKDFLKWVDNDLKTLDALYKEAAKDSSKALEHVVAIQKSAFSVKAQSGTFGYDLGSAIAKSLYDFCENNYMVGDDNHLLVIRKHIDTLNTIFRRNVQGDGGNVGQQVYSALGKLINKFDHPDAA